MYEEEQLKTAVGSSGTKEQKNTVLDPQGLLMQIQTQSSQPSSAPPRFPLCAPQLAPFTLTLAKPKEAVLMKHEVYWAKTFPQKKKEVLSENTALKMSPTNLGSQYSVCARNLDSQTWEGVKGRASTWMDVTQPASLSTKPHYSPKDL